MKTNCFNLNQKYFISRRAIYAAAPPKPEGAPEGAEANGKIKSLAEVAMDAQRKLNYYKGKVGEYRELISKRAKTSSPIPEKLVIKCTEIEDQIKVLKGVLDDIGKGVKMNEQDQKRKELTTTLDDLLELIKGHRKLASNPDELYLTGDPLNPTLRGDVLPTIDASAPLESEAVVSPGIKAKSVPEFGSELVVGPQNKEYWPLVKAILAKNGGSLKIVTPSFFALMNIFVNSGKSKTLDFQINGKKVSVTIQRSKGGFKSTDAFRIYEIVDPGNVLKMDQPKIDKLGFAHLGDLYGKPDFGLSVSEENEVAQKAKEQAEIDKAEADAKAREAEALRPDPEKQGKVLADLQKLAAGETFVISNSDQNIRITKSVEGKLIVEYEKLAGGAPERKIMANLTECMAGISPFIRAETSFPTKETFSTVEGTAKEVLSLVLEKAINENYKTRLLSRFYTKLLALGKLDDQPYIITQRIDDIGQTARDYYFSRTDIDGKEKFLKGRANYFSIIMSKDGVEIIEGSANDRRAAKKYDTSLNRLAVYKISKDQARLEKGNKSPSSQA